jgi:hypothetical protein
MLRDVAHWSIIASMNPATLAILFLILVGAALVYAALYALFAKPSTSQSKKRKQEVIKGFQLAGGFLLGFILMGSLVGFAGIAFGTTPSSLGVSRPFAAVIAVAGLVFIALMIQSWAKYFAGWLAWSILNALMMASSGHLLNNPEIPVRRSFALTMAGLCFVTVLTSQRFTRAYKLHMAEKLALMAWIVGFTVGANVERFSIPALAVGTFALVFVWWLHRSKSRRLTHNGIQRHEPTLDPPTNH